MLLAVWKAFLKPRPRTRLQIQRWSLLRKITESATWKPDQPPTHLAPGGTQGQLVRLRQQLYPSRFLGQPQLFVFLAHPDKADLRLCWLLGSALSDNCSPQQPPTPQSPQQLG